MRKKYNNVNNKNSISNKYEHDILNLDEKSFKTSGHSLGLKFSEENEKEKGNINNIKEDNLNASIEHFNHLTN